MIDSLIALLVPLEVLLIFVRLDSLLPLNLRGPGLFVLVKLLSEFRKLFLLSDLGKSLLVVLTLPLLSFVHFSILFRLLGEFILPLLSLKLFLTELFLILLLKFLTLFCLLLLALKFSFMVFLGLRFFGLSLHAHSFVFQVQSRLLVSGRLLGLLLAFSGDVHVLLGLGLNGLAEILLFLLLLLDDPELRVVFTGFSWIDLLIVFLVDLGVVLILAATAALLPLHTDLFQIAFLLGHQTAMLAIQGVLKLQIASVILRCEVVVHEF